MTTSFHGTENYVASPELMGAVNIAVPFITTVVAVLLYATPLRRYFDGEDLK